jgi:hypothetical protein
MDMARLILRLEWSSVFSSRPRNHDLLVHEHGFGARPALSLTDMESATPAARESNEEETLEQKAA